MSNPNIKCAGIDTSKKTLDVAIEGVPRPVSFANNAEGHGLLVDCLVGHGVSRVGIEASGNYEAGVVAALRAAGVTVFVLDPRQIHGWRRFRRQRAKTDAIDARLIRAAVAEIDLDREPPDPRLPAFAETLTLIDQIGEDVARLKTRRDRYVDKANLAVIEREILRLEKQRERLRAALVRRLRAHPDLAHRLDLLLTIPTIGLPTAVVLVVRMPELGRLTRQEAAALAGVAPYNRDSGPMSQDRHIAGGRTRLRKALYMAAFSGSQKHNPALLAFYDHLTAAGKHHKVALIACVRKRVHFANAVIARDAPWQISCP